MLSFRTLFGEEADVVGDRRFQVLILANVMAPLGPALVSPMLDSLTGPFDTSTAAIGLMISALMAPGIVLIPLAGALADRYGRRTVLVGGLVLFGVGGTAIAWTTDFRIVIALRAVQGVGMAGIVPVIVTSIGDIYEGTTEATGQGLRLTSSGIAQAVFPAIAGFLVVIAWQYPFLIYGLSLPIAGLVALWFDEPAPAREPGSGATTGRLVQLVGQPHVLALVVVFLTPMFLFFGFLTYVSVLVRLSGGSPAQAGLLVAVTSGVYALAASQAGRITARFDSRLLPLLGTNGAMGTGLVIVGLTPSVSIAAIGSALLGAGFGITITLYRSIATGIAPDHLRASLVGIAESLNRVGATASPVAMGAAVALVEPSLGFSTATRWTVSGVGVVGCGVGVAGLLVMRATTSRI